MPSIAEATMRSCQISLTNDTSAVGIQRLKSIGSMFWSYGSVVNDTADDSTVSMNGYVFVSRGPP